MNRIHTTQSCSLIGTFEEALIDTITIISALNIVVRLISYRVSAQCVSIKMDLLLILCYCFTGDILLLKEQ